MSVGKAREDGPGQQGPVVHALLRSPGPGLALASFQDSQGVSRSLLDLQLAPLRVVTGKQPASLGGWSLTPSLASVPSPWAA